MGPKTLTRTLAIKERLQQWRRVELYEAETRVAEAEQFVDLETERHEGAAALVTRAGERSASDLALDAEQFALAQKALKRAQEELNDLQQQRETRRDEVGEATREVKAIAALHQRMVVAERRDADLREQRDLDEASARKGRAK